MFEKALETKLPLFVGEKHLSLTPKFPLSYKSIYDVFLADPV